MQALYRVDVVYCFIMMFTLSSALQRRRCPGQVGFFKAGGNRLTALRTAVNNGNCEVVENNLIIWDVPSNDFSLLENITEIKGLLVIREVTVSRLPLTNLRVVRGQETQFFNPKETEAGDFSVALLDLPNLEEWPFPNLEEITEGSLLLLNIPMLAHHDTIDWEDIQNERVGDVVSYQVGTGRNGSDSCDSTCQNLCWTSKKCQIRSLKICHGICSHRCLGKGPFDCCSSECTGSCRAVENDAKCSACKTFENGDVCEDRCPSLTIYDRNLGQFIVNPNGRYVYEDQCVPSCPFGFVSLGQQCVHRCPDGQESENGVCVKCKGVCPKECDAPMDGIIDSSNVANFTNCTKIFGFILLKDLVGDPSKNLTQVTQDDLEAFSQVRSISQYLRVQTLHSNITSLKFFRNLETVGGQKLFQVHWAIHIFFNNGLEDLGFSSLHTVERGSIQIRDNKKLCFPTSRQGILASNVVQPGFFVFVDAEANTCDESNCSSQCNRTVGCWSPADADTCLKCASFDYEGRCVSNCTAFSTGTNLIYHNYTSQQCLPCHPECAAGCDGPNQNECHACQNVRDGEFCYEECPSQKYRDNSSVCQDCNDACKAKGECTGPGDHKGPGGCDDCDLFFVNETEMKVIRCVNRAKGCPKFYYSERVTDPNQTFVGQLICRPCHPSCSICHDAGRECETCNSGYVKDVGTCVEECPKTKYAAANQTCQICPTKCGQSGCLLDRGEPKCKPCKDLLEEKNGVDHCVVACDDARPYSYKETGRCYAECPRDTYNRSEDRVCLNCSDQCQRPDDNEQWMCKDGTNREESCLLGCKNVIQDEQCEADCKEDFVVVKYHVIGDEEIKINDLDPTSQTPRPNEEAERETAVIGQDEEPKKDDPREEEPNAYPVKRRCERRMSEEADPGATGSKGSENLVPAIVGATFGLILVIALIILVLTFGHRWYKERTAVYEEENMGAFNNQMYGGGGEMGMLDMKSVPAAVAPTDARLILAQESALEMEEMIGSGAFGTVYKGTWLPEGESEKIPVAIKVLNEGTGKAASKELLQEAVVMASMDHQHLVRLLCVCMASRVMLITQLMPLGSLLAYLKKRKRTLTGEALMVFSQQIAKGMVYLEEKRLVHRDLAARNVLVQTPKVVKISDFGLSKMLDVGEGHFQSVGEKMPIKWLAPECLQQLKFTHKSDVWAFGVTIWEVMTFGNQPFKGTKGSDMYKLLMAGERLPHPKICTQEVYALMLQCWMIEPGSRPTFRALARQLTVMCKNTSKFVTTEADLVMAESNAKMRTGTYETAVVISEWGDADDDGYDNAAGPTFNPYENPRDCIPEAAYSNTVQLDMIDEEEDYLEEGGQYDNTIMPEHGNSVCPTNHYENPRGSTEPLVSFSTENPYDNPVGEESETGVGTSAYDNIEVAHEDNEIHYDNPQEQTATDEIQSLETSNNQVYEDPDMIIGADDDDDMMGSGAGYQDPLTLA